MGYKKKDFKVLFNDLGLSNQRVVVHASISSLGYVEGGPNTINDALCETIHTCLMPAFSFRSVVAPPLNDRPHRNGIDYNTFQTLIVPTPPFRIEEAPIDPRMGFLPYYFAKREGCLRSDHPWASFTAWGTDSNELIAPYHWTDGAVPMERLIKKNSYVLLMGVTLTSCSAIHIANKYAGRKDFIRWALDRNSEVRRLNPGGGCSKGFDNLLPHCLHLFRQQQIGKANILVAHLPQLVNYCKQIIISNPEITRCSPDCLKCNDSILGGPID